MDYQQDKFLPIETLLGIENFVQKSSESFLFENEDLLEIVCNDSQNIDFFQQCPKDEDTSQLRQISQISQQVIEKTFHKKQICHCKKTKCLKMYCECFSQGITCSKECVCIGCHNDEKHNHRGKPSKRKNAQKVIPALMGQFAQVKQASKGCNCKKSHCQKKYCQCRSAGIQCSQFCQCLQCKNCVEDIQKSRSSVIEKTSQENTQHQLECEDQIVGRPQTIESNELSFIVTSYELLAEIDGYLIA